MTTAEFVAPLDQGSPYHRTLRSIAARYLESERRGHTLQPTALLHEAWLRLQGLSGGHLSPRVVIALYARAMRRALIDHARRRRLHDAAAAELAIRDQATRGRHLPDLDEALGNLAATAPRQAQVVELRFFGGLSVAETARQLGITQRSVVRDWAAAKAAMRGLLSEDHDDGER